MRNIEIGNGEGLWGRRGRKFVMEREIGFLKGEMLCFC